MSSNLDTSTSFSMSQIMGLHTWIPWRFLSDFCTDIHGQDYCGMDTLKKSHMTKVGRKIMYGKASLGIAKNVRSLTVFIDEKTMFGKK